MTSLPPLRRSSDRATSAPVDEGAKETLHYLAKLAVADVHGCDAAGISLIRYGQPSTIALTEAVVEVVDSSQYRHGDGPCLTAMRESTVITVDDFSAEPRWAEVGADALAAGVHSSLSVPLHDGTRVVGGLNLYARRPDAFTDDSRRTAELLGRQGGVTVRQLELLRTERIERVAEHRIAQILQRSLLPALPKLAGLTFACRYRVSSEAAEVGGDWYDAFELPGGAIGLAIGDVMGHDVRAAAAMGQLRSVLRAYAYEGSTPAVVLDRLDRLVQGFEIVPVVTALYARLILDGEGALMLYSNAGHLPPMVQEPDGRVTRLLGASSRLIGAPLDHQPARPEAAIVLPIGSTLVLYTDGLVETRELDIEKGMCALGAAIARRPPDGDLEQLCEEILRSCVGSNPEDDVALLAVRITGTAVDGRADPPQQIDGAMDNVHW